MTLIIGDREIKFISARLIRTMDTVADGCTAQIIRKYQDTELENLLRPYSFSPAQVFIGNQLLLSGAVYSVSPNISDQGDLLNIEIWSYTADLIDSTMPKPYEQSNITLKDRSDILLQNIGIKSVFDFTDNSPFDRVTADRTDTIFSHLAELANQRGFLLSSTIEGNLLFTKAKNSKPVGTLEAGQVGVISLSAKFDGRKLFNTITALGESPGNPNKISTITDSNIPKSRFFTFKADDTTTGNIETAAKWKRSKLLADSLTIPFPCKGYYAPNNTLYRENTRIIIKSRELFIPEGFNFLISRVEYVAENSGISTTLSLVPPTVYTGEEIILPWSA
jgi:prophage tail gpP-like protein